MFYWLAGFADELSVFNVFRYITFRTGAALLTALLVVFMFASRSANTDPSGICCRSRARQPWAV